jgi:glyoxylase-like metal-dependent hydrolase (beta-lactamase superfamily II)
LVVGSVELVPLVDAVGVLGELDELYPGFDDWEPYRELYPELFSGSKWRIACASYLIRSGGTTVLVDTGVGPAGLWGWTPEREEGLLPALAAVGVAPDEVDVVFLTHLHVDHVGWNTGRDGELVFPKARYVAHREGVAFARGSGRPHVERTIAAVDFDEIDGADGSPQSVGRALVRLVGLLLAIVPLFAGFLPVLFDARRRGLPDYLARTVVLYADR